MSYGTDLTEGFHQVGVYTGTKTWPQLADIDEELLTPPGMAAVRKVLIVDSESLERNG